jgi:hypothetical protein
LLNFADCFPWRSGQSFSICLTDPHPKQEPPFL